MARALALVVLTLAGCQLVLDFSEAPGTTPGADATARAPDGRSADAAIDYCANNQLDGEETATDCGGPDCPPCATGSACGAGRDCMSGACALGICEDYPRNCASALALDPAVASGVVTIDLDGTAPLEPITVYCEQSLAGGGWQLVSVVPQGGVVPPGGTATVPIVGFGYCLDPAVPCAGQIHAAEVVPQAEIAVVDLTAGDHLILSGFSASDASALRYLSMQVTLSNADLCTAPHVCGSGALDPDLVATTSGYALAYAPPLLQWWRLGGWWIGANPNSGNMLGNVFRTSYGAVNALSTRAAPTADATLLAQGDQRLYLRVPAVPAGAGPGTP